MKNKIFLSVLIIVAAFLALACNIKLSDAETFQKNCKNPQWEKPLGNPLHLYEYVYREESNDVRENPTVSFIVKHIFDEKGNIIESIINRRKSQEESKAIGEKRLTSGMLQLSAKPQFDKQGRITSVPFLAKDSILILEMKYTYPKEAVIEVEYLNSVYEERYQKNIVTIKDCKAVEEKSYRKNGSLKSKINYVSDLVTESTIHFNNGNTHSRVEKSEIIKKDSKGNWIEKTVKDGNSRSYSRIFRYYAYEKPTINYATPEDLVNGFLEAFQTGNFETLKKKGIAGKAEYMEMFSNSENYEPFDFVRKLGLKGNDFINGKIINEFKSFRSRKTLDWKNTSIENLEIEILEQGIYNTKNEGAKINFKFSDRNKRRSYSFPAVHLSSGWYYIIVK